MAVVIRLNRVGSKHVPKYRITVADSRRSLGGRHLEVLGIYIPTPQGKDEKVKVDMDKYNAWIGKGALPSDRVRHVIKLAGAAKKA